MSNIKTRETVRDIKTLDRKAVLQVKVRQPAGLAAGAAYSAVTVRAGDTVRRGQVIGYVGNTGRSKAPHLHWEVYRNGSLTDPLAFFR